MGHWITKTDLLIRIQRELGRPALISGTNRSTYNGFLEGQNTSSSLNMFFDTASVYHLLRRAICTTLYVHSVHKGDVNVLAAVPSHNIVFSLGSGGVNKQSDRLKDFLERSPGYSYITHEEMTVMVEAFLRTSLVMLFHPEDILIEFLHTQALVPLFCQTIHAA
ncbi:hypothetical protein POM88_010578 [Heracleum sosnowskyi]|uniref:Uncharacterized protein n=1 Tax=Heracleum sosnowskyi TaxID=360622 RepID=A0AAD8ISW9_9APIA|nr:hypothetical protein POM88_010578 [Heracleum sosnowskyi]